MLENLIGNLKSEVGGKIMSEAKLPSGQLDKVFGIIGDVTKKEVGNQMTGGGIANVMNLFSKQQNNTGANALQSNITSGVISGLVSKLGLSSEISGKVAGIAIPALINMITKKNSSTPDDDPSPLLDIFGGSGKGIIGNAAKGILGKFMK
ncbi:MAG: hypothetical protein ACM3UT_06250 [Chloroflexota bacterium]